MQIQSIDWQQLSQQILQWPYFWPTVIIVLLFLLIWRAIYKKYKIIHLAKHAEGKVSVMRCALIDLIENTSNDVVPNSKPRVCLCEKSGKLNIKVKIRVFANQNIEKTTSMIQKQISHTLQETLGIQNIGTINVLISDFNKSQNKNNPESKDDLSASITDR